MNTNRRRVVITGIGAITPLGNTVAELYQNQLEAKSGVGPITNFDASKFPTQFAGQVKDYDLAKYVKTPERWKDSGLNSRFAAGAAQQALADAGLIDNTKVDRTRIGVYLGSGEGIQDFHNLITLIAQSYQADKNTVDTPTFIEGAMQHFHPGREYEQELHTTPGHLADYFDLQGPNYNCLTACAASA